MATIQNPSNDVLKEIASNLPNAARTVWGNYSIQTQITARSGQYTFMVSDTPIKRPFISRKTWDKLALLQENYISKTDMIEITGSIGVEPPVAVPATLLVEISAANIAAMQCQLYFSDIGSKEPVLKVIYTPNLLPEGFPHPILIAVDLVNYTTRIFGTDYFGESKKAGLRMWNKWVYDQGGLALHAGCKTFFDADQKEKSVIIIGLSGTGKTTTTFNQHHGSLPVQDDFCALFPDGGLYASENGCFAKTFGLKEENEPVIYNALSHTDSWLENVAVKPDGCVDYLDGSYTTNGRGTFSLDRIPHRDPANLPEVSHILILNRNFDIIPAIAKLSAEQADEYFMLGETTGTSAGGDDEAGKSLRVPGTNPFFFSDDALQGQRFTEILHKNPGIQVILMNTGCIGGEIGDPLSIKVKIAHSTALIEALLSGKINWKEDPDFHYQIAANAIPGCPVEILEPKVLYLKQGRHEDYEYLMRQLVSERKDYLKNI
jgi:phosphoenolpyruvate carboxykinase (ATP)